MIKLEWSAHKNWLNILKHKIDFVEAGTVFDDPAHVSIADPAHSENESRFITIGMSSKNRLIIMAHTFEDDKIRIITERKPTRVEKRDYEEGLFDEKRV